MKTDKKSLSQQTADKIYDMIVKDRLYQTGEQLPNELTLSEMLGVSRTTLRDAVRVLTLQGILEVRRGKGTFVTATEAIIGNHGLENFDRIRIKLKDLFEMRLLFEPQVVAIACRRGTDEEIAAICKQGELVAELVKAGKDRTAADQEFHRLIVAAAHNDFMDQLIPLINRAVDEAIRICVSKGFVLAEETVHDHALMMEFLKKRDSVGAKNAMEIHIHHAIHTLELNKDSESIF